MSAVNDASQLAVNGGPKVRQQPWPGRALFGEEEKAAVCALFDEAIRTGSAFGYNGPQEEAYCREFAEYLGGGYADAVNSGSSAVYVALRALKLEPFTEVICPAITDPGGIMPIAMLNCIPIVADVRPGSYNIGSEQIAACLSERTSAIVVAHIAGEPADMDPILEIARSRGIRVVEDCAQAHGARYRGRPVGTLGDVGAFSPCREAPCDRAQGGVSSRATRRPTGRRDGARTAANPLAWRGVEQRDRRANMNLNDLSAAVGRCSSKLDGIIARRRRVAQAIHEDEDRSRVVTPGWQPEGAEASYWFLRLHVETSRITVSGDQFASAIGAEGIPVAPSYRGAFQAHAKWLVEKRAFGSGHYPWSAPEYKGDPERQFPCPNAVSVLDTDFNIFIHESCGEQEVADILTAIEKVEQAYCK